jgi:hypothetical protein
LRLLRQALNRDELATHLEQTCVPKRSVAVIDFLEGFLDHPTLSSWARSWLERFGGAPSGKDREISARAVEVLFRHTPPRGPRAEVGPAPQARARSEATVARPSLDDLDSHFRVVSQALAEGRVIPFVGAGINLSERPAGESWRAGDSRFLPTGWEMSEYLAEKFGLSYDAPRDLTSIAQYVAITAGMGWLHDELRGVFGLGYPPTSSHRFLTRLSERSARGSSSGPIRGRAVIVTTNFDDVLERTFEAQGLPYHRVSYIAEGESRGRFFHLPPGEKTPTVVMKPNAYKALSLDPSPVIVKLLGTIDRDEPGRDSFVITEDQLIAYLTRTDVLTDLPFPLPAVFRSSHFLFLGHGLRDWTSRAFLQRIWEDTGPSRRSWAVQMRLRDFDWKYWATWDVELIDADLSDYVAELDARMTST